MNLADLIGMQGMKQAQTHQDAGDKNLYRLEIKHPVLQQDAQTEAEDFEHCVPLNKWTLAGVKMSAPMRALIAVAGSKSESRSCRKPD